MIETLAEIGSRWVNFDYLISAERVEKGDGAGLRVILERGIPLRFRDGEASFAEQFLSDLSARRYVPGESGPRYAPAKAVRRKND